MPLRCCLRLPRMKRAELFIAAITSWLHPSILIPAHTVVIEALSCGLPVIGSASGGLPEMVAPSCGALIPVPLSWEKLITPTGEQLAAAVRIPHTQAERSRAGGAGSRRGQFQRHKLGGEAREHLPQRSHA